MPAIIEFEFLFEDKDKKLSAIEKNINYELKKII